MPVDSFFSHTCIVERSTPAKNTYGNQKDDWREVSANTPCRLVEKTLWIWNDLRRQREPVKSWLAILPADLDVLETDRLSHIVLEDGTIIDKKFVIKSLLSRRGMVAQVHKSAVLEVVQ